MAPARQDQPGDRYELPSRLNWLISPPIAWLFDKVDDWRAKRKQRKNPDGTSKKKSAKATKIKTKSDSRPTSESNPTSATESQRPSGDEAQASAVPAEEIELREVLTENLSEANGPRE